MTAGGLVGAVLVGVGGVLGALARQLVGERFEEDVTGTLAVNVLGSLVLGGLLAAPLGESVLLVAATGFCGAFTTFSSFAFETVRLAETGHPNRAVANAAVNLVGALVAVFVGGVVVTALL